MTHTFSAGVLQRTLPFSTLQLTLLGNLSDLGVGYESDGRAAWFWERQGSLKTCTLFLLLPLGRSWLAVKGWWNQVSVFWGALKGSLHKGMLVQARELGESNCKNSPGTSSTCQPADESNRSPLPPSISTLSIMVTQELCWGQTQL